jgi:hypothetical protein
VTTLGFFGIPPQFLYNVSCYHYYAHEENKICMYVRTAHIGSNDAV